MRLKRALCFSDVMLTPQFSRLHSRKDADLSTTIAGVELKIPIIAANMSSVCEEQMAIALGDLGGIGMIHRMTSVEDQAKMVLQAANKNTSYTRSVGFSIGVGDDWNDRVEACRKSASIVCLDVAHGHHERVYELLKKYYGAYKNYPIIIGQIATAAAANYFVQAIPAKYYETTALKASIGGGSLCTTRIKTGFGIPTLQAIMDIDATGVKRLGLTLIADGGIKNSGDIVKALAAGADAVMLGNLLAGTAETPGPLEHIQVDGVRKTVKVYRGSASFSDKQLRGEATKHIEGEETFVPYKGSVATVVESLVDGIRSGFSYGGASTLAELQESPEFVEISPQGFQESGAHGKESRHQSTD
jgi:IMP dehydrogenase